MGCNSSKDGTNPSGQSGDSSKAPAARAEEGNDNNTNANQGKNGAFTNVEEVDNGQTENGEINKDGGQLIINEETEKKSVKERQDTPVAEEDSTVKDVDIVVESAEQNVIEVNADDKNPSDKIEEIGDGEGQAEQTTTGDGNAEEQKLDEV